LLPRASIAPALLLIWLLWGWAAIRLMQGFQSGENRTGSVKDIGKVGALLVACFLGGMVFAGIYLTGGAL
jgi:hypothetical protein